MEISTLRNALVAAAHSEGGWGYVYGQPAHPEPTCLALLALSAESQRLAPSLSRAVSVLDTQATSDGAYRLARGRAEAAWPTAIALFTRAALGHSNLNATIARLKAMRGRVLPNDPETADMIDINVGLVGWPWAEGNFSWVEPTAWACLALRKAGHGRGPEVAQGVRLLLDRAFDEGGVNYGNRRVLGRMTEPIPTPTALMLLAVQGIEHPRIKSALDYLRESTRRADDLEHLAWARLAFTVHADTATARSLDDRIRQIVGDKPTAPPLRLALAILALTADDNNSFTLPAEPLDTATAAPPASTVPPQPPLFARIASRVRGLFVNGLSSLRQPPAVSAVHIAEALNYEADLTEIIKAQYASFREAVPIAGKRVVLKPNLVEHHPGKVINTDPRVIDAVISWCKSENAAEVVVAEGPGHWRNVQFLVESSGLGDVLRKHNVPFVDLNHDEPVKLLNLGRLTGLDYLYLARTVVQAEVLISMPKLKTHHWAGATLSLKNLFGTLPGICYGWPKNELHWRGIPNSIIDIALTNTPHLAIVDGIVGMEGDGPLNGTAKPMGILVMGADLPAVDATCCRLMGLDPLRVPYLILALQKKLGRIGESEIQQVGLPIVAKRQQFELPPMIEKHLARQPA